MTLKVLQPPTWAKPRGYANGISVGPGRLIFVSGQIGWDAQQRFVSDEFVAQARQALQNVVAVLAEDGAGPRHVVRLTWYVTSRDEYAASARELGRTYRELFGTHYPAMTAVEVSALMEPRAKVEIEATAVLHILRE